ncbi:nitrile hydratase subunit alpha [Sneathiella sp. CAU 1612]|uniref:nitrile hydratase n=1 Tax=Sneathiella sedimenti TaxID=2816034 RepID=A0ABS3F235_9PROT|nr:nitrile hydratase subunit alpha [Sneathiella sedimenti]MBO0332548.1 nitrile hydratase subunit alpha [Sneathiella sedimenti]
MASNHKHDDPLPDTVLRVKSLESLLIEKGLVEAEALDALIDRYENKVGPKNGAKVVARAWVDAAFRERLLADTTSAVAEFGYTGAQGEELVAVENTDKIHNVVVCTLCSCYPWPVLGLPPVWYKSAPYRARVVREPRKVLEEFGTFLPDDMEVRVWDSTAETRYLVIPKRPEGTDGMDEEALARLVNRDSMIGTREADRPAMAEGA